MTIPSGMAIVVVTWRMAFGNSLRLPLQSSISEDVYNTLGGLHNVRNICKAKAPILAGNGPPAAEILRTIHDRNLVVGAVGPARQVLADGVPPPPPFLAIQAAPPPPPSVPTSVVRQDLVASSAAGQGSRDIGVPIQLMVTPPYYQKPNDRPSKAPPSLRGSAAILLIAHLGEFPKLEAVAPSARPARANPVNQADGIYSPDPLAHRATVKAPPTGSSKTNRLHIVAGHRASDPVRPPVPPVPPPEVDPFEGLTQIQPKSKELSPEEQARLGKRKVSTGPASVPKMPKGSSSSSASADLQLQTIPKASSRIPDYFGLDT